VLTCCIDTPSFTVTFFRTSRYNLLGSCLDFSFEPLTERVGLSVFFVVGRNPFIDVNVTIGTLFTPLTDMSFSRAKARKKHGISIMPCSENDIFCLKCAL